MVCAFTGCTAARPASPEERRPTPSPLHAGPLTDYVPAAGLRWLVVVDVPEMMAEPSWRRAVEQTVTERGLRQFSSAHGIDLARASSLAVAGYAFGTLYLAKTQGQEAAGEDAFRSRARGDVGVERPHQRIVMLTALLDGRPVRLTSVRGSLLALATGDPALARVVSLYALGELEASPSALRSAALKGMPQAFHSAPLRAYVLGPIEPDADGAGAGASLVQAATALAISAEPKGDRLRVEVLLGGAWQPTEDLPALGALWDRVTTSPLGRLTRVDDPVQGPELDMAEEWLRLSVVVRAEPLLAGLRAAVDAEIHELFSAPAAAGAAPPNPDEADKNQ